jgi:hypothetical protein
MSYQKYQNLLKKQTNKRKITLFATNSAKINWNILPDEHKDAIIITEQYLDGKATKEQLLNAAHAASYASNAASNAAFYAASYAAHTNNNWNIIEQIYNDLFTINPKPPTDQNILNLAQLIYNSQDYSLLPILADALEEQGYPANHLRDKNITHYRGCDLIDQILGNNEYDNNAMI